MQLAASPSIVPLSVQRHKPARTQKRIVLTMLTAGLVLWVCFTRPASGLSGYAILLALVASLFGPAQRAVIRLDRALRLQGRQRIFGALMAGVLAMLYLLFAALWQHRPFMPLMHDEFAYLVQAQLIAHGRLWTPAHPLAEFFETFYVLHQPVYATMFFPGAALFHAPGVWMHMPSWVLPLTAAGAICTLLFLITSELISGLSAGLSVLMLLSLRWFRELSLMVMSHSVVTLLGLLLVYALLRWRKTFPRYRWRWSLIMGAAAGWAAITRPIDAVAFAVPVGMIVLIDLYQRRAAWRELVWVILAAAPFLSLQLIFDYGVTGQLLQTPYAFYQKLYNPQLSFGVFHPDSSALPQTKLPQKLILDSQFLAPESAGYTPAVAWERFVTQRVPDVFSFALSNPLVVVLLPLGIVGLTRRTRWVLGAMWLIFLLLYIGYAFLLPHYLIVAAPAVILTVLAGAKSVRWADPGSRFLRTAPVLVIIAAALSSSPEAVFAATGNRTDGYFCDTLKAVQDDLSHLSHTPAIVLFRFQPHQMHDPARAVHQEPVFTIDAVNPDDSRLIRAHDRGADNIRLFDYYARIQPDRYVYLFDRADNSIHELGRVTDLAHHGSP